MKGSFTRSGATLLAAGITLGFAAKVPVPENGCYLSAYSEGGQKTYETLVQKEMAVGMFYVNWDTDFPKSVCDGYAANGTIPHVSWEPFGATNSLANIISGSRDAYIKKWAQAAKAFSKPLFVRWALEMNGDWYDWDGTHTGGATLTGFGDPTKPDGPERFVAAHRHIHDLFKAEGVTNVSWVFAPNIISYPTVDWNKIANYYPGEAYIDWLGLDGYNWGNTNSGSWESFDQVFRGPYTTITSLGPQPVMIAEFASAEIGGNKAEWIKDAFAKIKSGYPKMKAITWFNINKETDWRVNSSDATLKAFQLAISDPYFLSSADGVTGIAGAGISAGPVGTAAGLRLTRYGGGMALTPVHGAARALILQNVQGRAFRARP